MEEEKIKIISESYLKEIPEEFRDDVLGIIKQDNSKFVKEGYEEKIDRIGRLANFYYDQMLDIRKNYGNRNYKFAESFLNYIAYYSLYNDVIDKSIDKIDSLEKRMNIATKRRELTQRVLAGFFNETTLKDIKTKNN